MNKIIMPPSEYDPENETLNEYIDKLNIYKEYLKKDKYYIILDLINELFGLYGKYKYGSLCEIKNLPIYKCNITNNKIEKIFDKYCEIINKNFKIDISDNIIENINDAINIIIQLSSSIKYKLKIFNKKILNKQYKCITFIKY